LKFYSITVVKVKREFRSVPVPGLKICEVKLLKTGKEIQTKRLLWRKMFVFENRDITVRDVVE